MGVAGLWPVLKPVSIKRSLATLALDDGFKTNPDGVRGLRVGIDASIWIVHATNWVVNSKDNRDKGENAELRTILFKCAKLMQLPFLPLFVFDGPHRPKVKRGHTVNRDHHWMVGEMQTLLSALGIEWRTAPGEAEAELAYLNQIGMIDCVLTDDVDVLLFGARRVMRNNTATLSFNRALGAERDDGTHTLTYSAEDVLSKCHLTRGGLVLAALISGGDYHDGVPGAGIEVGTGLARAGYGDTLVEAASSFFDGTKSAREFREWLKSWRDDIRDELKTNRNGHLKTRKPTLAKNFPEDFPDLDIVEMYVRPVTSEFRPASSSSSRSSSSQPSSSQPSPSSQASSYPQPNFTSVSAARAHFASQLTFSLEPSLPAIAHVCERYFEWGYQERIIKRFATIVWPLVCMRALRRQAILLDKTVGARSSSMDEDQLTQALVRKWFTGPRARATVPSRPQLRPDNSASHQEEESKGIFTKIHSQRMHASTSHTLEYRVSLDPTILVIIANEGIEGLKQPPDSEGVGSWADDTEFASVTEDSDDEGSKARAKKKAPAPSDPYAPIRLWLPASILRIAEPRLVEEWDKQQVAKDAKKARAKARAGARNKGAESTAESAPPSPRKKTGTTVPKRSKATSHQQESSSASESEAQLVTSRSGTKMNAKAKETAKLASFPLSSPPPIPVSPDNDDDIPSPSNAASTLEWTAPKARGIDDAFMARKVVRGEAAANLAKPGFRASSGPSSKFKDVQSSSARPEPKSKPKGRARADEDAPRSKVSQVAALFMSDVDTFKDLTSTVKAKPKLLVETRRTVSAESNDSHASNSTTTSLAELFSQPSSQGSSFSRATSTAASPTKEKPKPRPFPMSFATEGDDDDEDWEAQFARFHSSSQGTTKSTDKGKAPQKRAGPLIPARTPIKDTQKSLRRGAGAEPSRKGTSIRDEKSSDRDKTLDAFWSLSDSDPAEAESTDGRTSPTPKAKKTMPLPRVRPRPRKEEEEEVIVISSDEDEGATPHPPRIDRSRKAFGRGMKRTSDPREVIEID